MSKTIQQELDQYRNVLADFRKLYAEDGTIPPDQQSRLDVLDGKIKQLLSAVDGIGQPMAGFSARVSSDSTDIHDVIGGGADVPADDDLLPAPSITKGEKDQQAAALRKAAAKKDYEIKLQRIKPELDAISNSKPTDAAQVEIRAKIMAVRTQMELYANTLHDYLAAKEELDRIPPLLAKHKTVESQAVAKEMYHEKLGGIKAELNWAVDDYSTDATAVEVHKQLVDKSYEMESAAAKGDYVTANQQMNAVTDLISKYRTAIGHAADKQDAAKQDAAKKAFEAKWKSVKEALLKVLALKPEEESLRKILGQMTTIDGQMKAQLRLGDFIEAHKYLDQLISLHATYEKAEQVTPKYKYETKLKKIRFSVAEALSRDWESDEVTAPQKKVEAKKNEMEAAAAKKDYVQALKHLAALPPLLEAFFVEARKTPRDCDWVERTAKLLHVRIHRKYLAASGKLKAAAAAYKKALEDHKRAISKSNFVDAFLISLFFAGIGGAVGGMIGAKIKDMFDKAKDAAGAGALIDATKDIAKFTTKSLQAVGASPKPLTALSALSGDGVDLALSIGSRLDEEAANLLVEVESLLEIVRAKGKDCDFAKIRIAGDPAESLQKDPFLNILGDIQPDTKSYARLIWLEWSSNKLLDAPYLKYADDIREQTGTDGPLEERIKEAKRREIERISRKRPGEI